MKDMANIHWSTSTKGGEKISTGSTGFNGNRSDHIESHLIHLVSILLLHLEVL